MPNSVSKGFDTAMKMGSSKRFAAGNKHFNGHISLFNGLLTGGGRFDLWMLCQIYITSSKDNTVLKGH